MSTSAAAGHQATSSRAAEPSMEEILASIRKIIADDQKVLEGKASADFAPAPEPEVADEEDVLELGAPDPVPQPAPEPAPAPIVAAPVPAPAPVAPPVVAAPAPVVPAPAPQPVVEQPRLMSETSAATTASAFQSLANTVLTQNARTLDDLVKEMLRPMLKGWLDENLPGLVERLVRAEIERVARGGR